MQSTDILAVPVVDDAPREANTRRIDWVNSLPFIAVHVAAIAGVAILGWSWGGFALAVGLYFVRMFGVTGGYHRYFSHRTYSTSRAFQFVLALLAMSSVQKGVIWWASHHRLHHKMSDLPGDVHSVLHDGFWWSHVGWILSHDYKTTDASAFGPRKVPRAPLPGPLVLPAGGGLRCTLLRLGSWWGLVWGFFVSTTLLWHGTFTINSLTHVFGSRRYATTDNSRNNLVLALITMGEGWHNNHHYYQRATNQGFFWWEIDLTYYVLRMLAAVGLVLGPPSPAAARPRRESHLTR